MILDLIDQILSTTCLYSFLHFPILAKLYQLFEYVLNEIMLCRETSGWMRLNHMARMSIVYDVHMLFK